MREFKRSVVIPPNKQGEHWLNCLAVPRLEMQATRVLYSPQLDAALWEICDSGGLGDLEVLLGFDARDACPPPIAGREAEIFDLRDRLKRKQGLSLKKALKACGAQVATKGLKFDYNQDLSSTLKALFKKGRRGP